MLSGTDSALHRVISLSLMMSMIHTTGRIFSWYVCLFVHPRESHPLQSQSGPSRPVEETRRTILEQIVTPMRKTVVSTAIGSSFFWGLLGRSVAPNGTNETAHQPPVINMEMSLRGVAEGHSQVSTAYLAWSLPPLIAFVMS